MQDVAVHVLPDEPVEVDRHIFEVTDYLKAGYRGFVRINGDKFGTVLNEFGTVDEFPS